jgi:site-specific DNA recombinase
MRNSNNSVTPRFAALIRVSTEKQEQEGESLRTQTNDNKRAVEQVGGRIVTWYGGQEHATPGHEKKEIDRLLHDAASPDRNFDAVIVAHADRWSRDNSKSHEGLEVFRKHAVRFFVGVTEYDLFLPEHCLFLELSAAFGQFQTRQQNLKSIRSRINRAQRGIPTCGKLPFGRVKDPTTGKLVIDPLKQNIIRDVAKRYLKGEHLPDLAREYRMNHSNLHKILKHRSGAEWEIEFSSPAANIHERVKMEIPPLLDSETIADIQARMDANRTYTHGQQVAGHKYLLSRMIFCAHCGYSMFGQTSAGLRRYYRHLHTERAHKCCGPKTKSWIRAGIIEDTVLRHLFACFGNPIAIRRAIEEATPNLEETEKEEERIGQLKKLLARHAAGTQRLVKATIDGTFTEDEVKEKQAELKEQEQRYREELHRLRDIVASRPTRDRIEETAQQVAKKFAKYGFSGVAKVGSGVGVRSMLKAKLANRAFEKMSWSDKRALLQMVFSGKRPDGHRMGVFVEWLDSGQCRYSIHGHLIDESDKLQASKESDEAFPPFGAPGIGERQNALVTKCASH